MKKIHTLLIGAAIVASGVGTAIAVPNITNAASAQGAAGGVLKRTHDANGKARLNQAVRDGTITDAQKTAFLTEITSLKSERKSAITKTSTKDQKQAERTKLKTELKAWASTNNFPLAKVFPKLAQ